MPDMPTQAQEKHAEALRFFQRATQLDPNSFDAWFNLGYTLGELKRYAEALLADERATALDPNYAAPGTIKARRSVLFGAMRRH